MKWTQLVAVAVVCAVCAMARPRALPIQGADGVWKTGPWVNPPKEYDAE
jgi:hypothetical protein